MQVLAATDRRERVWERVLHLARPVLLLHPLVPLEECIHRGDDAFYYFQLARNHVRYGFWSFDGIHASNRVQALWAWITAAIAAACMALLIETRRWRLAIIAGAVAGGFVLPYLTWNLISTGHLLPVSGAAKAIYTAQALADHGVSSRFSPALVELLLRSKRQVVWFFATHLTSPYWVVGGRLGHWHGSPGLLVVPLLLATAAAGLLAGRATWLALLRTRLRALRVFASLGVYGVVDAIVSVVLYPTQLGYAMTRWWFVENGLMLVVLGSTMLATTLHVVATRIPALAQPVVGIGVLVAMCVAHGVHTARHYWDGATPLHDWNPSWNEFSHEAAGWLRANVAHDVRVGAWNAGVIGYFAAQPVVNLADMESMVERHDLAERLHREAVYARHSPLLAQYYRIYRVRGVRRPVGAAH